MVDMNSCFSPAHSIVTGRATKMVWKVVALFEAVDGVRYARLVNRTDPSSLKTVAVGALEDPTLFHQAL
jgi:hypothetical protein